MSRIVVIGAGLAGLSAAIRLADFGHDVTVLESADHVGGQAARLHVGDSRRFDAGPFAFTLPAVLRDLFRKTGRPIEKCLDLVPSATLRTVVTADRAVTLPNADRAGIIEAIDRHLGPGVGRQWDAAINSAGRMWGDIRPFLDRPMTVRAASGMVARRATRRATMGSLAGFALTHLADPCLRTLLGGYAHRLGTDPVHAPAAVATLAYLDQTFGLWTVDGGFGVLVDALHSRAVENGSDVQCGVTVEEIIVRDGQVVAAVTDTASVPADLVVCTAPVPNVRPNLLSRRQGSVRTRATRSTFTVIAAGTAPDGQVVIMDDVLGGVAVNTAGESAVAIHASCEPHGHEAGEVDWTNADTVVRRAGQLVKVAADAGLVTAETSNADWTSDTSASNTSYVRTPYDLEQAIGAPGGRVSGSSWLIGRNPFKAPTMTTSTRGLLIAGGHVHPGPTVPFSIMSGGLAADYIGRA